MRAAYATAMGGEAPLDNLEVGDLPRPEPGPGQALVRVGVLDNLDPDNIPLPDMTAEEAESALDTLLQDVDKEEAAESEGADATEEKIESEASEAEAEVPAEEDAEATEETPAADEASTDKPAAE